MCKIPARSVHPPHLAKDVSPLFIVSAFHENSTKCTLSESNRHINVAVNTGSFMRVLEIAAKKLKNCSSPNSEISIKFRKKRKKAKRAIKRSGRRKTLSGNYYKVYAIVSIKGLESMSIEWWYGLESNAFCVLETGFWFGNVKWFSLRSLHASSLWRRRVRRSHMGKSATFNKVWHLITYYFNLFTSRFEVAGWGERVGQQHQRGQVSICYCS